ncbi:MAG: hypothetical protein V1898_03725 [Patescibacteria group bacterium]
MSTNKIFTVVSINVFIFIGGIIVGFIIGGITGYGYLYAKDNSHLSPASATVINADQSAANPNTNTAINTDSVEPSITKIYRREGVISEIQADKIIINGLMAEKENAGQNFVVQIDDKTQYGKINLNTNENIAITLSDLKTGDYIYALATENILNQTQFYCNQVNLFINE